MKQKRALIISDPNNIWTKYYIEGVLLPAGYQIVVFPIWGYNGKYSDYYAENNVIIYEDKHTLPIIRHIPRVRMYARIAKNAKSLIKMGPFDVVHNHYLSVRDLALGEKVKKAFGAKWICSYWGSDLLRSTKSTLLAQKKYLIKADAITVFNENNIEYIRTILGDEVAKKTYLRAFGVFICEEIDKVQKDMDKAQCKAHFGIGEERFVVAIGYNASSAHCQLEAVKTLSALREDIKSKMTIVLQHTYGLNDEEYVRNTYECVDKLGIEKVVFKDFMSPRESAILRSAVDVFVHVITTDSNSASLREYLYAGSVVIKGGWLPYPQLEKIGVTFNNIENFNELPSQIESAFDKKILALNDRQRGNIKEAYDWSSIRLTWTEFFE